MKTIAIIVHGGAGNWPSERHDRAVAGCERARDLGYQLLLQGIPALDVVEQVVMALEDDPTFNAGFGSHPNQNGDIEMDALIVDGRAVDFGAVAAIQCVRHPIAVARKVLDASPHCMLAAEGALAFARAKGIETVATESLLAPELSQPALDTVGAVALDRDGHIAAATSTGGTRNKMPGRVGDSPLIGCGAYADDTQGGASATGVGEYIMRTLMSKAAVDALAGDATAAAQSSVDRVARIGGHAGIICLDPCGRVGFAHNTPHMALAFADSLGTYHARV